MCCKNAAGNKKKKASSFVDSSLVWIGRGCPRAIGWGRELEHLAKVKAGAVALVIGAPAEPAGIFLKKNLYFGKWGFWFVSFYALLADGKTLQYFPSEKNCAFRIESRAWKSHT